MKFDRIKFFFDKDGVRGLATQVEGWVKATSAKESSFAMAPAVITPCHAEQSGEKGYSTVIVYGTGKTNDGKDD